MDPSMHHSGMDMDHGHGGHGDMDMGGQCNMNMLFTWSSKDLCIIFRQWRVDGPFSLLVSLVVIVLLTAGYEGIRQLTRRYEAAHAQRMNAFNTSVLGGNENVGESAPAIAPSSHAPHSCDESSPLLVGRDNRRVVEQRGKLIMATLYAVQVFYSFFIMLLFMTYNGLVMIAVAVGAFVGYLVFGDNMSAAKTVACH
ncbi:Ctr copper transporter family-domain-containing protein [Aspergillus novoparasiticus]|uniref:Copper transport protein n=1 Tax=Aspergillus novoparasiticus TaxID=986946 RepID=A0A5N6ESL2_9EURO|nr:Ctr copper transporter family-domain-containing protein [Aspergillus novoparasiticus]